MTYRIIGIILVAAVLSGLYILTDDTPGNVSVHTTTIQPSDADLKTLKIN